jgi:uncharacterized protein YggE
MIYMQGVYMKKLNSLVTVIISLMVFALLLFVLPIKWINWGKIEFLPASTITVTGSAKEQQKTQIASFNASYEAESDNKQDAIAEVNVAMEEIIQLVKDFGIEDKDIKTQSVSAYKYEEPRTLKTIQIDRGDDEEVIENGEVQWRAQNNIMITLRDVDQASELADLLGRSRATNFYGPNFSFDDTTEFQAELLSSAIDDAREKAEKIAKSSNRRLGKIITVNEGSGGTSAYYPKMALMEDVAGAGAPLEPGSGTVSQSVTVVFELK